MKKIVVLSGVALAVLMGVSVLKAQNFFVLFNKEPRIIYFNPDIYPNIEEIKQSTNEAFFDVISTQNSKIKKSTMLRAETFLPYDSIDAQTISEYCKNNNADFAVVPKVKYFKVGLGKYIFSNQVIVSMKFFDAQGNFITETDYDTYKKNMRMLGSTVNSIRKGTEGAFKELTKNLRKLKPQSFKE